MKEWTREWPKKPGFYWFYGYRYGVGTIQFPNDPRLQTVHVGGPTGSGNMIYVDDAGSFMYKSEVKEGWFLPLDLPDPPPPPSSMVVVDIDYLTPIGKDKEAAKNVREAHGVQIQDNFDGTALIRGFKDNVRVWMIENDYDLDAYPEVS